MPFDAKPPHFWPAAEGFVPDCVRHKAKKLWHSFFEFAQIYIYIYIPGFLKTESLILLRAPGGLAAIGSESTLG